MPATPSFSTPKRIFLVLGISFLGALLIGATEVQFQNPGDLLNGSYLIAILIYTLIFASPVLLMLALVRWLERKA